MHTIILFFLGLLLCMGPTLSPAGDKKRRARDRKRRKNELREHNEMEKKILSVGEGEIESIFVSFPYGDQRVKSKLTAALRASKANALDLYEEFLGGLTEPQLAEFNACFSENELRIMDYGFFRLPWFQKCRSRFDVTQFMITCRFDSEENLRRACKEGVCVDQRNPKGMTALMYVSEHGRNVAIPILLEHGACVDAQDKCGRTALAIACEQKNIAAVQELCARGANPDLANAQGIAPLNIAIKHNNYELVRVLCQANAAAGKKLHVINSALMCAVECLKNIKIIEELCQHGATRLHKKNRQGHTVLALAAIHGYTQAAIVICRYLQARPAVIDLYDKQRLTPLMHAVARGNTEIVHILLERGAALHLSTHDGLTVLMLAVLKGDRETVEYLCQKGADIHTRTEDGRTARMLAQECLRGLRHACPTIAQLGGGYALARAHTSQEPRNYEVIASFLQSLGCSDEPLIRLKQSGGLPYVSLTTAPVTSSAAIDEPNMTHALVAAIEKDDTFQVQRILNDEAWDVCYDTTEQKTILMAAVKRAVVSGNTLILNQVLHNETIRTAMNRCDRQGRTAAMMALENESVSQLLERAGANMGMCDLYGRTPLIQLLHLKRLDGTRLSSMLNRVAAQQDIDVPDHDGYTPLMYAVRKGNPLFVRMLLAAGARTELRNYAELTALDMARYRKDIMLRTKAHGMDACDEIIQLLERCATVMSKPDVPEVIDVRSKTACAKQAVAPAMELLALLKTGQGVTVQALEHVLAKNPALLTKQFSGGLTPLMCAVQHAVPENVLAKMLGSLSLEHIMLQDTAGKRAIDYARSGGAHKIIRMLEAYEGRWEGDQSVVAPQARRKNVPRLIEAIEASEDIIALLRDGADSNVRNQDQQTPAMVAALRGNADALEHLIRCKAELDAVDITGKTALMLAICAGQKDSVWQLLNGGACVTIQDAEGMSARDYAVQKHYRDAWEAIDLSIARKALRLDTLDHALQWHLYVDDAVSITPYRKQIGSESVSCFPTVWSPEDVLQATQQVLKHSDIIQYEHKYLLFDPVSGKNQLIKDVYRVRGQDHFVDMQIIVRKLNDNNWSVITVYPLI